MVFKVDIAEVICEAMICEVITSQRESLVFQVMVVRDVFKHIYRE